MDGIFNISELPVLIAEALPGEIPVPLQLLQGGSDRIHTVLTDMGEPLCGIDSHLQPETAAVFPFRLIPCESPFS